MTVERLAAFLDERIPCALSEPWDHDGRMVIPCKSAEVKSVLCALDCTSAVIENALKCGANVIVTHHPLLFRPLDALTEDSSVGKRVLSCVQNGIAVLSYHTRLDSMEGGVNDCLASALGLKDPFAFLPFGRIGDVEECSFDAFCAFVGERLQTKLLHTVCASPKVRRVAVISGCGKDEIEDVLRSGADTFVTGEVMHNHLIDCKERGLNLITATHEATESVVLPFLAELIGEMGVPVSIADHI